MSDYAFCAKCGSDRIIDTARFLDATDSGRKNSEIGVEVKPYALMFRDETRVPVKTHVCGACGFVELYVQHPGTLWSAHQKRQERKRS